MEVRIELGHMNSRESTREEMLRELLAFRLPPNPVSDFLPTPTLGSPCRGLRRTVKFWSLFPRRQGTLLTSRSDPWLW